MRKYLGISLFILISLCLIASAGRSSAPKALFHPELGGQKPYQINRIWYCPLPSGKGFVQKGKASWYGSEFHRRRAASGERFNMHAMTAAHKSLPMGTYVKVTRVRNGRSVTVRINDRGPFLSGRIIDLSHKAAKELGIIKKGVASVRIEAVQLTSFIISLNASRPVFSPEPRMAEGAFCHGGFMNQANDFHLLCLGSSSTEGCSYRYDLQPL